MTPADMAQIHARAYANGRAWSEDEIAQLITEPGFACTCPAGFAIGRAIADEAELIMLAVDSARQGQGHGRALMALFDAACAARNAQRLFLEVAADNAPAIALYDSTGWHRIGLRKGYYRRSEGQKIDAILYEKRIP